MIEDELKPEYDVLNSLIKSLDTTRTSLGKITHENNELKIKLLGEFGFGVHVDNFLFYFNFPLRIPRKKSKYHRRSSTSDLLKFVRWRQKQRLG